MVVKKSKGVGSVAQRLQLLDKEGDVPSRKRQCDLPGLNRSTTYYERRKPKESPELKEAIEQLYEEDATLGRHMDVGLCLKTLEMALGSGRRPMIFNTDQGSQYTSEDWQKAMQSEGIQISMDGKGRWADNIIMERPHSALGYMSPQQYRVATATPLAANFWRDFSAPAQLAALRAALSLRSGRYVCATKSRQKWIDIKGYRMI